MKLDQAGRDGQCLLDPFLAEGDFWGKGKRPFIVETLALQLFLLPEHSA